MRALIILALLLAISLMGCLQQPQVEKEVSCPAEKYKLLGKDLEEPGWVVGEYSSSSSVLKYVFEEEWEPVLLSYAMCSYKGFAGRVTGEGGAYFIYIYPNKEIADEVLKALKEKIEEKLSVEQVERDGIRVQTLLGEFTFVRYGNAIIGAYGLNEGKVVEAIIKKIESS